MSPGEAGARAASRRARAPDGSPVAVYAAMPAEPEFTPVLDRLAPGSSVLDLGCGTGRLADELARRGHEVVGVDESGAMLERLSESVRAVCCRIEDLELRRRFDGVVLASYLVNSPSAATRRGLLEACARHVAADGQVLLARLEPEWARRVTSERAVAGGVAMDLEVTARSGPLVELRTTFLIGGGRWAHDHTARVLEQDELVGALWDAGLRLHRQIDPWWVAARPAPDP